MMQKCEHVDQDTRSQDGKDDKDLKDKDLKISELKSKSKEKAQDQKSQSMKEQSYNKITTMTKTKSQEHNDNTISKSSKFKGFNDLTPGEIVSLQILSQTKKLNPNQNLSPTQDTNLCVPYVLDSIYPSSYKEKGWLVLSLLCEYDIKVGGKGEIMNTLGNGSKWEGKTSANGAEGKLDEIIGRLETQGQHKKNHARPTSDISNASKLRPFENARAIRSKIKTLRDNHARLTSDISNTSKLV
ncbi:hypothetical protein Tco_1363713 [Tanacetum coccineum]